MMTKKAKYLPCYAVMFFALAGCGGNLLGTLPPESEYWLVEPMGTPLFVYLDANNEPVTDSSAPDTGKTLVFIEGNPLAGGAAVLSQSAADGHDGAVYIINRDNDSVVSLFFHEDQRFPWKLNITRGNERITAELSAYDWFEEKFTVSFQGNGGETKLENLKLAQQVMLGYTSDPGLSEKQNTRLRDMYTALGMYESISRALPGSGRLLARSMENTGDMINAVFCGAAPAAFAVTVQQPGLPLFYGETARTYWRWIRPLIIINLPPLPPPPPPLTVTITQNGVMVHPDTVYYLDRGGEMIFDFAFTNFNGANVTSVLYDSETVKYHHPVSLNGCFYEFTRPDGSAPGTFTQNYRVKVRRTMNLGYCSQGYIQLVVFFGQNTIVNGNSGGVLFREPATQSPALNRSVFVLHFNVFPGQPNPFL
jgi:hypothetical protein